MRRLSDRVMIDVRGGSTRWLGMPPSRVRLGRCPEAAASKAHSPARRARFFAGASRDVALPLPRPGNRQTDAPR